MQHQSNLTDRNALALHRARAMAMTRPALFLHEEAARLVQERLDEINRRFTAPAIVTHVPEIWRPVAPGAKIIGDDDTLGLGSQSHDLVIHALSLHWANDPVGQVIQARRALRPDGMFLAVTFGGQTLSELRSALADAETRVTGGLSPRVAPFADVRDLGALLQRAGLALPVADNLTITATYETAYQLMLDLRAMGETNALAARHRFTPHRALFSSMIDIYAKNFSQPDGRVAASFEFVFLTGWAPSENQQKPMRPGSATTRLADVLQPQKNPRETHHPRRGN